MANHASVTTASVQRDGHRGSVAPMRSSWLLQQFRKYGRGYVKRQMHAVRLARGGYRPNGLVIGAGPVLVVLNHPSWWDPMIGLVLSEFWPESAKHFAPIESAGLAKYPFLERLGFFGVDPGTPQGGLTFLRRCLAALDEAEAVVWVTAQGRFADVRERPTRLKEGVGHLAHRLKRGSILPLALEYAYWEERTPEALVRFGSPIFVGDEPTKTPAEWTSRIELALEQVQDKLAEDAITRDASRFETLLQGGAGVGGIYDLWRRLKAFAKREQFVAEHGAESAN